MLFPCDYTETSRLDFGGLLQEEVELIITVTPPQLVAILTAS